MCLRAPFFMYDATVETRKSCRVAGRLALAHLPLWGPFFGRSGPRWALGGPISTHGFLEMGSFSWFGSLSWRSEKR